MVLKPKFFLLPLFFLMLCPHSQSIADENEEAVVRRKAIRVEASSSMSRDELSSRFAFLSKRLSNMPELPKIERLDEMAAPPSLQGKEISFGTNGHRKVVDS